MKVICVIRLTTCITSGGVRCRLKKAATDLLGDEIVFQMHNMCIKRPAIDSHRTYSIKKTKVFTFFPKIEEREEYIGFFKFCQKDEDTFYLKKVKDDKLLNKFH